jgi:hypothetical protein
LRLSLSLLGALPGSEGASMSRDMDDIGNSTSRDPNTLSTKELHDTIWKILSFRDKVIAFFCICRWIFNSTDERSSIFSLLFLRS